MRPWSTSVKGCSLPSGPYPNEILALFTPLLCVGVPSIPNNWGWAYGADVCVGSCPGMTRHWWYTTVPQDWRQIPPSCLASFIRGTHLKRLWWEGQRCIFLRPDWVVDRDSMLEMWLFELLIFSRRWWIYFCTFWFQNHIEQWKMKPANLFLAVHANSWDFSLQTK